MNKTKSNQISLTSLELEQIGTAIKNLTNILNKYEVKKEATTVSQKKFNVAFNNILKGLTKRYLSKTGEFTIKKTFRIEVCNTKGEWLINYSTNPENPHFWYNYDRIYVILQNQLSLQDYELQRLMKRLVESQFKMKDTIPMKIL